MKATVAPPSPRAVLPRADASRTRHARDALELLFGPAGTRAFCVRLWDGTVEGPPDSRFTLVLRQPDVLRRVLLPPSERRLAEAFARNDLDIEGDLEAAVRLGDLLAERAVSWRTMARVVPHLLALPRSPRAGRGRLRVADGLSDFGTRHAEPRDAAAIRFHYDLGDDFYALWLDRRMVYSCAYFATGAETLDDAQEAKLDLTCRKLRVRPGERLLDIGCGWGGLVLHAVQRYGVEAVGVTLSHKQAAFAHRAIAEAGLAGRAEVCIRDYRRLREFGRFDKIASVGMLEHVRGLQLESYFATAFDLLRPGGVFLTHGIVALDDARRRGVRERVRDRLWRRGEFIERYIFPDGEVVQLAELVRAAELAGFETRDVESLREHYARTLRHWSSRLEAHHAEAAGMVGEAAYRVWRLYLAAAARGFATGRLAVVQLLLAKPDANGRHVVPLTRSDLYGETRHGGPGAIT